MLVFDIMGRLHVKYYNAYIGLIFSMNLKFHSRSTEVSRYLQAQRLTSTCTFHPSLCFIFESSCFCLTNFIRKRIHPCFTSEIGSKLKREESQNELQNVAINSWFLAYHESNAENRSRVIRSKNRFLRVTAFKRLIQAFCFQLAG